jgi:hypothetical protein
MTSWECYENKWFYMKYIGKMVETESLLSTCCTHVLKKYQFMLWLHFELHNFLSQNLTQENVPKEKKSMIKKKSILGWK